MKQKMKKILIGCTMFALVALLGVAAWLVTRDQATEGVQEAKNALGIEWYDVNGKEFTISTVEEFYEFNELSSYYDFAGQTIYLGADIVVNEGNAADWGDEMPERMWESIAGFAGTFDGQGHSISGICSYGQLYTSNKKKNMDYVNAALFRNTTADCVIKNFKLLNSYFLSDMDEGCGSISSNGGGTFDSIYSDAIIVSYKCHVGGILGRGQENTTITNCWFDGSIDIIGNYGRFVGGILGNAESFEKFQIEHCLFSGVINSDLTKKGVQLGGILGAAKETEGTITDCLVTGEIYNEWKTVVGSLLGNIRDQAIVTVSDVFTTKESFEKSVGNVGGTLRGYLVTWEKQKLIGTGGYQWTLLDFDNYWVAINDNTPILKTFADDSLQVEGLERKLDVSWYDENKDTYILNDAADFYGFAVLSDATTFEGKTIKLGANITLNEGKASDWIKTVPSYKWFSIGSTKSEFEGTFDGQMHTISGIYLDAIEACEGLFGVIGKSGTVKNFRLKNSYFETTANSFGSIAGRCRGKIDTVYSNAIVVSSATNVGGMIGQVPGSANMKMTNCWFDGSVTNTGNSLKSRITGGLIGVNLSDSVISNCLNSGVIDASAYTVQNSATSKGVHPHVGGLVGNSGNKSTLKISYCMNVGKIKYSEKATSAFGSIIGYAEKAVVNDTFATTESCKTKGTGSITGTVLVYDKAQLSGYGGYKWTTLNFQKYWSVVLDDTSILRSFAGKKPSLDGITRVFDTSWYDEKADTYILNDMADLYGFALVSKSEDFAGKTVKLGADIKVNEGNAQSWMTTAPEYAWMSIGTDSLPFEGTFDGQMKSISGIYLNTTSTYGGLFGVIGVNGTVKNVLLKNSYFETTANSFGSIAGRCRGKLDTVYSDAIVVSSAANVGGLIGQIPANVNVSVTNCWFDGSVTNTGNSTKSRITGGLIGVNLSDSVISNCLNSGVIDASAYTVQNSATSKGVQPHVGGLVGNSGNKSTLKISYSMNVGEIKYSEKATSAFGSIIGYAEKAVVNDTFATTESCKTKGTGTITGIVLIYDKAQLSGYGGYKWTTLNFQKYWSVVLDDTSILRSFASQEPSLDGITRVFDTSWYDEKADTYILNDMADLYGFALVSKSEDFADKTVKLGADITVNEGNARSWATTAPEFEWMSIGTDSLPFEGTFDGQMKSISGIYLNTTTSYGGLFGVIGTNGVVKNLKLKNSYLKTTANSFGSIAGRCRGQLDTVYSDAIVVSSAANVGGLIGQIPANVNASVTNCWFNGSVTNSGNSTKSRITGGLIGYILSDSVITNCLNSGTIDVTAYTAANSKADDDINPHAGGLIGNAGNKSTVEISNCMNVGEVKYNKEVDGAVGAIVGYADNAVVSDTYVTTESCKTAGSGKITGFVISHKEAKLQGYGGYQWTTLDFKQYWSAVSGDTPELTSFANSGLTIDDAMARMFDVSWYDAEKDTYTLSDAADFYGFAYLSKSDSFKGFKDKTIQLDCDITINEGTPYGADGKKDADSETNPDDWDKVAPEFEWVSIGSESVPFAGTFDGAGFEISGVYFTTSLQIQGLVERTTSGATIKNLKLINSYFKSTNNVLGSVVGRAIGGEFYNIYSNAIVECEGADGITGITGGIIGQIHGGTKTVVVDNCWFAGTVTNNKDHVGGVVGRINAPAEVTNCLNTGEVSSSAATTSYVGGVIGSIGTKADETIQSCLTVGTLNYLGGADKTTSITGTYKTTDAESKEVAALTKLPDLFKYQTEDGKYTNDWVMTSDGAPMLECFVEYAGKTSMGVDLSWYDGDGDYTLSDEADFYGFALMSQTDNFDDEKITLAADITINEGSPYGADGEKDADDETEPDDWDKVALDFGWLSIGSDSVPFAGEFDGNGKTISGIYLSATVQRKGLFGTTNGATIKNFKLVNSYFCSTNQYLGSVVGRADNSRLENIYSEAIVSAAGMGIGGIVGHTYSSSRVTINNCWFAGMVECTNAEKQRVGGIIGQGQVTMTNCLNTGTVTSNYNGGSGPIVGGLIGLVVGTSSIDHCLNTGSVNYVTTESSGFGSLIGGLNSGASCEIENSYALKGTCDVTDPEGKTTTVLGNGKTTDLTIEKSTGVNAFTNMPGLFKYQTEDGKYTGYWAITSDGAPILESFAEFVGKTYVGVDLSWYNGSHNYTLSDEADFYGLALLSQKLNFAQETITLADNIIINEGTPYGTDGKDADNAAKPNDWDKVAPDFGWLSIGSDTCRFAGEFDGNGMTLSGVYMNATTGSFKGLFGATGTGAEIHDFRLVNSYFTSTNDVMGSVVGRAAGGEFYHIYSNAIVETSNKSHIGGILGQIYKNSETVLVNDCWFAGSVKALTHMGGIVGRINGAATMTNCLNSGEIISLSTGGELYVGGLAGSVGSSCSSASIKYCLNVGSIYCDVQNPLKCGALLGCADKAISLEHTYATTESCSVFASGNVTIDGEASKWHVSIETIKGDDAKELDIFSLSNLNHWVAVSGSYPVLKQFEDVITTK